MYTPFIGAFPSLIECLKKLNSSPNSASQWVDFRVIILNFKYGVVVFPVCTCVVHKRCHQLVVTACPRMKKATKDQVRHTHTFIRFLNSSCIGWSGFEQFFSNTGRQKLTDILNSLLTHTHTHRPLLLTPAVFSILSVPVSAYWAGTLHCYFFHMCF